MSQLRDDFCEIVRGWTLTSGVEDLGERIEAVDVWAKENGLLPAEQATLKMMVETQVVRGIARGDFEPFIPRRVVNRGTPIEDVCDSEDD